MKATAVVAPSSPETFRLSPWHTPVPYFFGGLSVLLGLIAFALLILACSYGNLSDDIENGGDDARDLETGDSKPDNHDEIVVFEEKYVVIMAGKATPSFLAIPVSSGVPSFGRCSCSCRSNSTDESSTSEEKEKGRRNDLVEVRSTANHETQHQLP
ncbi:hypothetical protein R6Q59_017964 [Mikania micrantha]|uniref:Uncharacterized protein n=1 Tax=Mikania micrantha TaxID=192012 RepID=A0A5N6M2P5_9ASTR|nr:hypothetical protein E3N88_35932 [Mikania micrantha]